MTKLNSDPIAQADIEEYLADYSDFNFELRVLRKLKELNLECEHSGTYDDPLTGKSREFDIRALLEESKVRIHLSVECKNIQDNFPLVVHCIERSSKESYSDLIYTFPSTPKIYNLDAITNTSYRIREKSGYSCYKRTDYVAKSADQVGRDSKKAITATDGGVFEKISQAIHSAKDLILAARNIEIEDGFSFTFVCPVLVVPDSKLWQVKYTDIGNVTGKPEQIKHISYYIGKEWAVGDELDPLSYKISHLEIVTFSELDKFIRNYLGDYIDFIRSSYGRLQGNKIA